MLSSALRPAGRSHAAAVSIRVIELTAFVRSFAAVTRVLPCDERFHENVNCASSKRPELSIADDLFAVRVFPGAKLPSLMGNEGRERNTWSRNAQSGAMSSG
jgi:hypothetical protein